MTVADDAQTSSPQNSMRRRLNALMKRRATWVLADQGMVSLGNFLTQIYLLRGLIESQFGAYQVLYDTMLYLNGLQAALIIYPLTVRGATSRNRVRVGQLATCAILLTIAMLPLLGGATIVALHALNSTNVAVAAILAMVLLQLQETTRRALISDLRFQDVVWGDAISYLLQAVLVVGFAHYGILNLNRTFIIMAVTSAAAIVVQALQIGLRSQKWEEIKTTAIDFWRMGRWILFSSAASFIPGPGYSYSLLIFDPTKSANALFGAIGTAMKLANPVTSSMNGLITPAVARESTGPTGMKGATRMALRYITLGLVMLAPYFLLIVVFATPVLVYLSKGGKTYSEHPYLLRLYVANYLMVYLMSVVRAWLAGLGHGKYIFYVEIVNTTGALLVGLPMTIMMGVAGLCIGGLASSTASTMVAGYFIYKLERHPPATAAVETIHP